jgi:hypothetical protein
MSSQAGKPEIKAILASCRRYKELSVDARALRR